jgi:hypothetical protein
MNFDLILKLIRLANNNPNDNEANLAARKVCVLLKDHNFNSQPLPRPQTASQQNPYQRPPTEPAPTYTRTWNPPPYDFDFGDSIFEEFFRKRQREYKKDYYTRPPTEKKVHWNKDDNQYYTPPSKQKEERDLECKTCHKVVKTKFVGHPQLFECNTCQWTAYERLKENRSI